MRFTEIANPEDQLALWRMVSDKMWAAFAQQPQVQASPVQTPPAKSLTQSVSPRPIARVAPKPQGKRKATPAKAVKPKRAPMAPAPKPLPKPKAQQVTPSQASKQQTQQHQQLAKHIHQAMMKKPSPYEHPQPIQSKVPAPMPVTPMNNSYSERDKDELVFHRRENPLKPLRDQKSL